MLLPVSAGRPTMTSRLRVQSWQVEQVMPRRVRAGQITTFRPLGVEVSRDGLATSGVRVHQPPILGLVLRSYRGTEYTTRRINGAGAGHARVSAYARRNRAVCSLCI